MIRRIFIAAVLALASLGAWAQLTQPQRASLKAYIDATPALTAAAQAGNIGLIERSLNAPSAEVVWRSTVQTAEVGRVVNYIAVEAMTTANRDRIITFYTLQPESFAPTADVRSFWANTFSGALGGQGQATRDALDALWRRLATVAEGVLAPGTGTTATPSTLAWEGTVTATDVELILAGQ